MALPYIVEQYSKEKYSEPLIQNSNIFSVGTGKDANGNEINVSNNVEYGQISAILKGVTRTNLIKSSGMNTDSNADGVVDNFNFVTNIASGVTKNLNDNAQRIVFTSVAENGKYARIVQGNLGDEITIPCVAGDKISARVECKFVKTSGNPLVRFGIAFYDSSGGYLTYMPVAISANTSGFIEVKSENKTAPANTAYARIMCGLESSSQASTTPESAEVWFKNAMLEKSATVGNYISSGTKSTVSAMRLRSVSADESQESIAYLPDVGELRSLPNGVKDEVNVTKGKMTRRVGYDKNEKIQNTTLWQHQEGYDLLNTALFYIAKSDLDSLNVNIVDTDGTANGIATLNIAGINIAQIDSSNNLSTDSECFYINPAGTLGIRVLKSKLSTINQAGFTQYLQSVSIALTYQLATPIVTPIDVDGNLYAYPNGTIMIDPYHKKQHTYSSTNGGLIFPNKITRIDKIEKIVDGKLQEITFTPAIAEDGLSATIAELADDDVVTIYAPIDPSETTIGTSVISYPINQKAQIMSNTASTQKHDKQIINIEDFMVLAYVETQLELAKQNVRISTNQQTISDLENRVDVLENPVEE